MDWKHHWSTFPANAAHDDFFRQVGKTVGGQPITAEQFQAIVESVAENLELRADDDVLDLCCGNGIITRALTDRCGSILGIDYSEPLISTALEYNFGPRVRYVLGSVLELTSFLPSEAKFDKILMYEALQHFAEDALTVLLSHVKAVSRQPLLLLLASVPDRDRIWNFYNTPERRAEYHRRKAEGTEAIGTWWSGPDLLGLLKASGFKPRILSQPTSLHTQHYRMDILASLD